MYLLFVCTLWSCLWTFQRFFSKRASLWIFSLKSLSTYICRVQSCISRLPKYWPPPPSLPSECVLPPHQRRGYTLAGRWGGWGVNILEDERHRIGHLQYNLSTPKILDLCMLFLTLYKQYKRFSSFTFFVFLLFIIQQCQSYKGFTRGRILTFS
jgi:hypothetical protein